MFENKTLNILFESRPDQKKQGLSESPPKLYFHFTYSICHRELTISADGSQYICTFQEYVEPIAAHCSTNISLLNDDRQVVDEFSRKLARLGICSEFQQGLVSYVIQQAKHCITIHGGSDDPKIIPIIKLNLHLQKYRYFDEQDVLMMESMAEFEARNYGMVPADPSSLSCMLKSIKLEEKCEKEGGEEDEICSVCLEEVVDVASAMPCAHLFHENCIVTWLQTSHVCPVCRFLMPTVEDSTASK
ncbi:E3 ubiquitin-protein ligase RNF126 [Euphorbia peplus]|nr:E3 ubiquitin-protein ligase RNF126 [Euphorbia peplus]